MDLTATQARLELDTKRMYARQQATMLIMEMVKDGYIAPACTHHAIGHLTELFYKHGVEITTADEREIRARMKQ